MGGSGVAVLVGVAVALGGGVNVLVIAAVALGVGVNVLVLVAVAPIVILLLLPQAVSVSIPPSIVNTRMRKNGIECPL